MKNENPFSVAYKKKNFSDDKHQSSGMLCKMMSINCFLWTVAMLLMKYGHNASISIVFIILLPVIGVVLWIIGMYQIRLYESHKKKVLDHLPLVKPKGITDLEMVAQIRKESFEEAVECVQELIDRGYFEDSNAYIDYANKWFVGGADESTPIKCPGCGASWVATKGAVDKCPFCGEFLKLSE